MALITFMTFNTAIDARILMARLESEGIECILFDEHTVGTNPLLNFAVGGIKLKIHEEDLQQATRIVKEINSTPYTDENDVEIACPHCNSTDIYSGFATMSDFRSVLAMVLAFICVVLPIHQSRAYKCKSCNAEFKLKVNN